MPTPKPNPQAEPPEGNPPLTAIQKEFISNAVTFAVQGMLANPHEDSNPSVIAARAWQYAAELVKAAPEGVFDDTTPAAETKVDPKPEKGQPHKLDHKNPKTH